MEALKYMYEPGEHATVKILLSKFSSRSRENGTKNLI